MNATGANFVTSVHLKDELVRCLLTAGQPSAIILFGSEARGHATEDSDLDILIIEPESPQSPLQRATTYRMALLDFALKLGRGIDILVYTPQEIEEWASVPNAFLTTAVREGKVLYEYSGGNRSGLAYQGR